MKSTLTLIFILALTVGVAAQKKEYLSDPEIIEQKAKESLDNHVATNNNFQKYISKNDISGTYVYDIVIWNKGEVASVNAISREGEIKSQNLLKDYLKEFRFPLKLPKNQQYKFRYTFNLK